MRLPVAKAYRAFKELDRFSDAQCVTFARAARPRRWRSFVHEITIVAAALMGLVVALAVYAWMLHRFFGDSWYGGTAFYLGVLPTLACAIGVGPLVGFMVRDFLLRRGIRRVLISRGSCPACKYVITGLVVDGDSRVRCPECGAVTTADATLGEIVTDENGVRMFLPSPEAVEAAWPVFLTRARVLRWLKLAAVSLVVLMLVCGVFAAWWEWSVRQQAAAANAARNLNAFVEYSLSQQPEMAAAEPTNGFDLIVSVNADLDKRVNAIVPDDVQQRWSIHPSLTSDPDVAKADEPVRAALRRRIRASLAALRRSGAFEPMNQVKSIQRAVEDPMPQAGRPLTSWVRNDLVRATMKIGVINSVRMRVASQENDLDEFAVAAEVQLALARLCELGSTLEVVQWSARTRAVVLAILTKEIATRRDPKWIDVIEALVSRQDRQERPTALLDVRRLYLRDVVCVAFSDPSNFRFGRWSNETMLQNLLLAYPTLPSRPSTFDANLRVIEKWHERYARAVTPLGANWSAILKNPYEYSDLTAINLAGGLDAHDLKLMADAMMCREALRAVIAIERHRLETGVPPAGLEDLVPSRLAALPRDPWSGGVLRYRLERVGVDPAGCGYVLYSVGIDGRDQGGSVPEVPQHWRLYEYGKTIEHDADVVLSP
jgi:hypothetical protein